MSSQNEPTSLDSPSSEDLDDLCLEDQELVDIDISVAPKKRHFLDYDDAVPPPGFEDDSSANGKTVLQSSAASVTAAVITDNCPGETVKIDKKYERDGEISDYELAASGVTKRLLTPQRERKQQSDRILNARKKKHFLDENPIPPDYMLDKEREHRSLDRNFERQQQEDDNTNFERKHSLDRNSRVRKIRGDTSNYHPPPATAAVALSSFVDSSLGRPLRGTWPTERPSDNTVNYSSMPPGNLSNLGPKVECVYSLLSMLGSHDSVEMSKKFLELSRSTETCATLRRSGCIPLLVQMMHSESDDGVRKRAAMALHNVVHCHPDDKAGRREAKVLRLIEQIMDYCNFLKTLLMSGGETIADDTDRHPLTAISSLMKVSFDEEHRHAMCQLGALQAIASLVHLDHAVHGPKPEDQCCNSLRRYALMALTNLTFGDGNNKALLCANKEFMEALVAQLDSAPDDLLQVTASVLRNLSWRADNNMKAILNEIGTVTALANAAMKNKNENTLKAILSALWNLSAHCSTNKAEFCAVDGALAFLVDMLTYEGPSKTLKIIENAGGILRNVSSHIAVREDYRKILRQRNCLSILLQQLKSESLTVVSNACGTLWNLSARFPEDQKFLWDNGAVPMLRSLIHSKHKMISEGSSAALKNLLNFRPGTLNQNNLDPIAKSMGLKELPTLTARKQRALEQELNHNLAETCENLDAVTPPKDKKEFIAGEDEKHTVPPGARLTKSTIVSKSESRDSIVSAKSDSVYEKLRRGHSIPPPPSTSSSSLETDVKHVNKSMNYYGIRNNFVVPTTSFDVETENELPIDYSAKYNSEVGNTSQKIPDPKPLRKPDSRNYSVYQETDLDQPTDFSLRYAENQIESDSEEKIVRNSGSEIILIMEDTVKCYQTEDTPYVISNAGSDTDIRHPKQEEVAVPRKRVPQKHEVTNIYGSGSYTPEKPINYCEEGTPGYFSRYESLSSLDEASQNVSHVVKIKPEVVEEESSCAETTSESRLDTNDEKSQVKREKSPSMATLAPQAVAVATPTTPGPTNEHTSKVTSMMNSAQETPLMFSRRSSMDSLASAEPITADDKSSVVSDFSRLASGVISPSELPDSPTQSMPQSPRRNSNIQAPFLPNTTNIMQQQAGAQRTVVQPRLRSVFEDDVNTFLVENTPAQFSCATSLSNLSIDDEPKITNDTLSKKMALLEIDPSNIANKSTEANDSASKNDKTNDSCALSDGEEATNDDILLATCINIGMNRGIASKSPDGGQKKHKVEEEEEAGNSSQQKEINPTTADDVLKQYCTEDTPALLSKVGSNSNLSALSLSTNRGDVINLSDESSNASDGGTDLLEQCIREGMQKPLSAKQKVPPTVVAKSEQQVNHNLPPVVAPIKDPIAMLRRGGLPPYLPVRDEMNKFVIEDSPCNFSVVSGLSNLTVGSELAGPANIKKMTGTDQNSTNKTTNERKHHTAEDSLSSISIESEDDTNLLSQAIAAGCNRPKSNLGKIAINAVPSSSKNPENAHCFNDPNDSISSVDSSDSNDNHAKSLFEQCIRSGMNKQTKKMEKSIPKQVITVSKPMPITTSIPSVFNSNVKTPLKLDRERQRERERKDEQLLRECINTGIAKNARPGMEAHIKPPARHVRPVLGPTEFNQRLVTGSESVLPPQQINMVPKNGEATSVAVLEQQQLQQQQQQQLQQCQQLLEETNTIIITSQSAPNTAPGVGMRESPDGTNNELKGHQTRLDHHQIENIQQNIIGFELLRTSQGSLNLSDHGLLDQSNEYPALKLSNIDYNEDSVNESSFDMEVSNEFLIEKDNCDMESSASQNIIIHDKHKDPDLMLKSVERLTQELVSTAEYLRTNVTNNTEFDSQEYDSNNTVFERKSSSNSNSNNTWNEDTCPNDVSFPSVSLTAPMIASLHNDDETTLSDLPAKIEKIDSAELAEITPTNETNPITTENHYEETFFNGYVSDAPELQEPYTSQPNSLETETDTLINDEIDGLGSNENKESNSSGIQFKVGGEVQQIFSTNLNQFVSSGPMSFDGSSTMTSSTIIAMEANKLAQDLMKMNMADSTTSLDLDNIRPPSCMDYLSTSGCFDIPQSPQLPRRKKSLPAGLVAKRALAGGQFYGGGLSGSAESVNSSCNLDNIKPPSLMDELLDSMISVESITSEIVENSLGPNTNYMTAFSDVDENTTTLQSCMDALPTDYDDSNGTPIPSDFSSAESTPRKGRSISNCHNISGIKRTLTPKQKRRFIKDRYKTYTIAADYVLKENYSPVGEEQQSSDYIEDDEIMKIEIEHKNMEEFNAHEPESYSGSDRFHTITIERSSMPKQQQDEQLESDEPVHSSSVKRRSLDPDRFKTRTIFYKVEDDKQTADSPQLPTNYCIEQESLTSTEDSEELSSIRAMTKQFKYITQPSLNLEINQHPITLPVVSPLLKSKFLEDETRATTESDYNSMECDQNSETESCDQNGSRTDEESSPTKHSHQKKKAKILKPGDKDSGTEVNCSEDGMTPTENVKTVRGRKKPPYVSPYKRSVVASSNGSSKTTSPKSQIGNTVFRANLAARNSTQDAKKNINNIKHIPRNQTIVAKTHVLINKTNFTNKINATKSNLARPGFATGGSTTVKQVGGAAKKNSIAEKNFINKKLNNDTTKPNESTAKEVATLATPSQPLALERQGTFVKEEASNPEVPVVTSLPPSPAKISRLPTKTINATTTATGTKPSGIPKSPAKSSVTSKLRPSVQQKNPTTADIKGNKVLPKTSVLSARSRNICGATNTAAAIKTEVNNSNETTTGIAKRKSLLGGVRKSTSVPIVPQRSNSNTTLRAPKSVAASRADLPSTTPPSRSNSNLTSGRPQVGSRIASIWKKPKEEEYKKSSQTTSPKVGGIGGGSGSGSGTNTNKPPTGNSKLIRSSTFDNSPNEGKQSTATIGGVGNTSGTVQSKRSNLPGIMVLRGKNQSSAGETLNTKRIPLLRPSEVVNGEGCHPVRL